MEVNRWINFFLTSDNSFLTHPHYNIATHNHQFALLCNNL